MKMAARIYRWILISVMLQLFILCFFNYIYLPNRGAVKVSNFGAQGKPKVDAKLTIPSGAEQIKVSFDGAFSAYFIKENLEIIDIQNKKSKKTINLQQESLSYYRWLPDRNMIIYALNSSNAKTGYVQIITHDVESGLERKYPRITGLEKDSKVIDIELSPLTNIVYAVVQINSSQAKIYKFDIMDKIRSIIPIPLGTIIKETNYSDKLVYQDKNKLFVRDGMKNSVWPFPFKNKMVLLDIDSEDRVYVGELNIDNKISKIHYGKLSVEPNKAWTPINIKRPALPKNIFITRNGTIYQMGEGENAIYNIPSDVKHTFSGRFVEVLDDYFVTIDDDELKLNAIKISDDLSNTNLR